MTVCRPLDSNPISEKEDKTFVEHKTAYQYTNVEI